MAIALVRLLSQSIAADVSVDPCGESRDPSARVSCGACENCGDGAPSCEGCLCCPHPRTVMLRTEVAASVPVVSRAETAEPGDPVERTGSDEIFHIPKYAPRV